VPSPHRSGLAFSEHYIVKSAPLNGQNLLALPMHLRLMRFLTFSYWPGTLFRVQKVNYVTGVQTSLLVMFMENGAGPLQPTI